MARDTALSEWYVSRYSSIRVIWLKISSFRGIKLKILLHRREMSQETAPFEWDGSIYYSYWVMCLKSHLFPSDRAQSTTPSEWDGSRYGSFRERLFKILFLSSKMTQDTALPRARCLKMQLLSSGVTIYSFWLLFGGHAVRILAMAQTILTKGICCCP